MTDDLVKRLRDNTPLPVCPYDRRSPDYYTAPNDAPCVVCGSINEVGAPDLCTGADTRLFAEAADRIEALTAENERLRATVGDRMEFYLDRIEALNAENKRLREALTDIGVYGCGMLNQPAALNGPEEEWLKRRIWQMESVARAALGGTQ